MIFDGRHKVARTGLCIIALLFLSQKGRSQACCSGGTPLLSSIELPAARVGTFQLALTYEYNTLGDVLAGSTRLNDNSRRRTTHSALLETNYGLASFLSLSLLLSAVRQERTVQSPVSGEYASLRLSGVGDAIILLKHNLLNADILSQSQISIGVGAKIPLGASTTRHNGILAPAEMQPGSGAWDAVFWLYASQGFVPDVSLTVFATATYRLTGTNQRYGNGLEGYRFGNEFVGSIGAGYRTDTPFDFSLSVRIRNVAADRFADFAISNTGGTWITILPGVNLALSDALTARAFGQFPLYRNLEGTQLTTTFTAGLTLFYTLQVL